MMNNNNHQTENCTYAAEIVSYIYGEIGAKEKSAFEAHLADCATCPEELADFMDVRFAVADWKETEFAPLATPAIEIPYEKAQTRETVAVSGSWWSNLRQLWSLSPAWTASAAMAALVICFSLFFAISRFSGGSEIAGLENKPDVKPTITPTTEVLPPVKPAKETVSDDIPSGKSPEPPQNSKTTRETDSAPAVVRIVEKPSKSRTAPQNSGEKTNNISVNNVVKPDVKRNSPARNQPLPKLNNYEEDEDDSLRLAELFDEIDTLE